MFAVGVVSPGYFEAMRIALVEGRVFDRLDEERDAPVVIVSRSLARAHWPGESALGKGIRMGAPPAAEGEAWSRIGGVVDDVHETALHEEPPEIAYYPVTGETFVADVPWPMSYVVRAPNAAALAGPVREAVRGLDPALPVIGVETLETRVGRARGTRAFVMVLLVVAAGLALLLGAVGLYGIVSYHGSAAALRDLVHAERLAGPVSDQIDAGIAFVARFTQSPADKPSSDTASYDLDVVDEAIVNAVAHRDYAISGSKIRLFLFADRLELYSPGKLPNTITLDDMPYRTFTRNQLLVSFLSRIRSRRTGQVFLESRGEGVRKILRHGEAHSGRRPDYALFGDELRLTLWAKDAPAD